jgi:hypothetical protein
MILGSQRTYSLSVGIILFVLGFFGFAFKPSLALPDQFLFMSLVLGFWGVVVGARKEKA